MKRGGFTLPAVLVSSIVLMLLLIGATQISAATVRALREQYYTQLAREAAEAGAERIGECIRTGHFHPAATITPKTDCEGTDFSWGKQYLFEEGGIRTSFKGVYITSGGARLAQTIGQVELTRKSDGVVYATYTATSRQQVSQEIDPTGSRASKRWWYFGKDAALDFGTSGNSRPRSRDTGKNTKEDEGVTTVSDRHGELKFFSDGLAIWDKDGSMMPIDSTKSNANPNCDYPSGSPFPFDGPVDASLSPPRPIYTSSQKLCGSYTATQAVVAFPVNNDETKYVVVTNTTKQGGKYRPGTLFWSLVDFSDPAYPKGIIRERNNSVAPRVGGSFMQHYASEALNARPNADGTGVIIYTYKHANPNELYAFTIYSNNKGATIESGQTQADANKILLNKFTFNSSNGGLEYCWPSSDPKYWSPGFGAINFNKENTKLVLMMGMDGCGKPNSGDPNRYKAAGRVHVFSVGGGNSVLNQLNHWSVTKHGVDRGMGYSADFSPSGRYIYASTIYSGRLFRYDLSAGNNSLIKNSERFIGNTACSLYPISWCSNAALSYNYEGGGQVLRGPDDRMYVADNLAPWISVVDRPDADSGPTDSATSSNVGWAYGNSAGGIKLPGGARSRFGLPQMVSLYTPRLIHY